VTAWRRISCACLLGALLLTLFSGCARKSPSDSRYTEDGRIILRVSMYNSSSYPLWRAYVEEQCPDIFIQWENNRNSAANVLYLAEHGDMPDIVAIRRFESDTAAALRPYLADLSGLPLTATYDAQYLEPFAAGGRQYWLPGPGAFDGIVANTDLFSQYHIDLPTDITTFLDACRQLENRNVAVFAADCAETWTPTQMIEGFGASLLAKEGADWVHRFESGEAESVDSTLFLQIAAIMQQLHENGILTQEDLDSTGTDVNDMMIRGEAAMVRKNSDESFDAASSHHYTALPFFSSGKDNNWLCTYPVFSLAMSNALAGDDRLYAAGEELLTAMLSPEAQAVLNKSGEGLISYNKNVTLPLSASMQNVQREISADRCFIRVLNSNTFRANSLALTALVRDGATGQDFVNILNKNLFLQPDATQIGVSSISAPASLDKSLCSPAASVVAQVIQRETGADCAVIDVREAPNAIYPGSYTQADIDAIVSTSGVYTARLRPDELRQLFSTCVLCSTTFQSGAIEPILEYPAAAGVRVGMHPNGEITDVRVNGRSDDSQDRCLVAISGGIRAALSADGSELTGLFQPEAQNLRELFTAGFQSGGLPQPQQYFTVQ